MSNDIRYKNWANGSVHTACIEDGSLEMKCVECQEWTNIRELMCGKCVEERREKDESR